MQMHEAVRSVFQAILEGNVSPPAAEQLEDRIADAFVEHGLDEHGYADDYKAFALNMLQYFVSSREGSTSEPPTALSLTFGDEQIVVKPDDILVRSDGSRTLRRVLTGHRRSSEGKDVGAAAFMLATQQAFPDAVVELVHLSDKSTKPLTMSSNMLQNRNKKLATYLDEIRRGRFPKASSPRVCPGCPAFFVCGPTPPGTLRKKFEKNLPVADSRSD